jgi:hypothetical protein
MEDVFTWLTSSIYTIKPEHEQPSKNIILFKHLLDGLHLPCILHLVANKFYTYLPVCCVLSQSLKCQRYNWSVHFSSIAGLRFTLSIWLLHYGILFSSKCGSHLILWSLLFDPKQTHTSYRSTSRSIIISMTPHLIFFFFFVCIGEDLRLRC